MADEIEVRVNVPSLLANATEGLSSASSISVDELAKLALARQTALVFKKFGVGVKWTEMRRTLMQDTSDLHPERKTDELKKFVDLFPGGYCEPATKVHYSKKELTVMSVHVPLQLWELIGRISERSGITKTDLFVASLNRLLVFAQKLRSEGTKDTELRGALQKDLETTMNRLNPGQLS